MSGAGIGAPPFPVAADAWRVLERLWAAGHAGHLVGGAVRDALLGRPTHDWDVATDARPERLLALFPEGRNENRFGTVAALGVDITTFRKDHQYADHRRPDRVTFTDSVREDLLRRDFTVNAIAWGRDAGAPPEAAGITDPTGGQADLDARLLRAVGDPAARFGEDALRLLRAARIASAVGLAIEPGTLAAMRAHAGDVRWVSGERVGLELRRMLEAPVPSRAFRILEETGLLAPTFPELVAGRCEGSPSLDLALAVVDAAAGRTPGDEPVLLAALVGGGGGSGWLHRLALPTPEVDAVRGILAARPALDGVGQRDAAVRALLHRFGASVVRAAIALGQAESVATHRTEALAALTALGARVEAQLASGAPLTLRELAVDGTDLMLALDRPGGPWLGRLLEHLMAEVLDDPARNTRPALLALAARASAD